MWSITYLHNVYKGKCVSSGLSSEEEEAFRHLSVSSLGKDTI